LIGNLTANRHNKEQIPFKNGFLVKTLGSEKLTAGFEFLRKNPVAEIVGLDFATMIIPRTTIDMEQNPIYGCQTLFREAVPLIPNPFLPGLIGYLMMKSKGYQGLNANSPTMNALYKAWSKAEEAKGEKFSVANPQKSIITGYIQNVFKNTEGLVGKDTKSIMGDNLAKFSENLADLVLNRKNMKDKEFSEKLKLAAKTFTEITGAEDSLCVKMDKRINTTVHLLIKDTVDVGSKIFISNPPEQVKGVIDDLSRFAKKKTAVAIGSAIALASSLQFINLALTKKITGKEGFAGYKDFGKEENNKTDTSEKEKPKKKEDLTKKKIIATAGMAALMLTSIGAFSKNGLFSKGGLKNFAEKLELKQGLAHMDMIKTIYSSVLIGRFWAAQDNTELNVSIARDYTGFLNWLVLGGIVAKGAAHLLDPSLVNVKGVIKDKNPLKTVKNWFENVSLKTIGERQALTKTMSDSDKLLKAAVHNGSMLAGLMYSMFALGIGVPLLINKYIINKAGKEQPQVNNAKESSAMNNYKPAPQVKLSYLASNENGLFDNFIKRTNKVVASQ